MECLRKILFVRTDRLGEFLLSLPAIALIKQNYPAAQLFVHARPEHIELIQDISFVDGYIPCMPREYRSWRVVMPLVSLLRKQQFDCVVVSNPLKQVHFAAFLAQIPVRVGYRNKWPWCLSRAIENRKLLDEAQNIPSRHESEYNIDLAGVICRNVSVPRIELPVDAFDTVPALRAIAAGSGYVVVHPFSSNPDKKISHDVWAVLMTALKKMRLAPVVIGIEHEEGEAAIFARQYGAVNMCGRLRLRELAVLLKHKTTMFIGLDSGPMHMASMLNIPVLAIFCGSNINRWGPRCTRACIVDTHAADSNAQMRAAVDFISKIAG